MILHDCVTVEEFIYSTRAKSENIDNSIPNELKPNAKAICSIYCALNKRFNGNIRLNSGYRSKLLNEKVGGSEASRHRTAEAIDVRGVNGVTNDDIFQYVRSKLSYRELIWEGLDSKGNPRWVHISACNDNKLNIKKTLKAIFYISNGKQKVKYVPI